MAWQFGLGGGQPLSVESPAELLEAIESLVETCLETGNVFAIIDYKHEFVQLFLDADHDMHIETSVGDLAQYAGFNKSVPEFEWLAGNRLPADWPARAKMAAEAMSRAFIDAAKMTFPATLKVSIHPTTSESAPPPLPQEQGHPTIGFCFGEDRSIGSFVDELGPALGVTGRSIEAIYDAIQTRVEAQLGKLTRTDHWVNADVIVELGGSGPTEGQRAIRFAAPHGLLVVTNLPPGAGEEEADRRSANGTAMRTVSQIPPRGAIVDLEFAAIDDAIVNGIDLDETPYGGPIFRYSEST